MSDQRRPWHYAIIMACALLVTLPLFTAGPSCGHDFDFHLQSWFAASATWHAKLAGHLLPAYPHWVPAANYGAGEPRFAFYPPLSWVLGAILGSLLPWTMVAQAFTLLALAGCGLSFYALARHWVRAPIAAGAACVYLANPYLLFVAYERTAYGELLGAITMPLVVLYTLRHRPAMIRLAIVVAILWFTNAPAAVMGCYLLAFCAGAAAFATRSVLPAARSLVALLLGTGAAGVYVLPAWYEQRWVEIARVVGPGMRVEDSFLFRHTGEPFHDQVLHTASWLGVLLLGVGLLCAAASRRALHVGIGAHRDEPRTSARLFPEHPAHDSLKLLCAFLAALMGAILLLLLPLSHPIWRFAPELHFLQFPWRWLLVGSLAASLALALGLQSHGISLPRHPRWALAKRSGASPSASYATHVSALGLAAVLCAGAWYAGHFAEKYYAQSCDEEDNVRAQQTLLLPADIDALPAQPRGIQAPAGFEGTDEYTPAGAENGEIQQGLPAVRLLRSLTDDEGDDSTNPNPDWSPRAPVMDSWRAEDWGAEHKRVIVQTHAPRYAVLRLLDYPAWRVLVNGRPVTERPHREDGLMTLPVPPGRTCIEVTYQATPDVYAGRMLSLASLAALGALAFWQRFRRAPA